jgi:uncharacterized glyoxalase superfamily protein PhnB
MSKKPGTAGRKGPRRIKTGARRIKQVSNRKAPLRSGAKKKIVRRGPVRSATQIMPVRLNGSGLAPGMESINTYLAVANVGATMAFLERAFGFLRGVVLADTDGQPRYAEMRHQESVVMLIRKGDTATPSGGAAGLYTYVDDVDRALAQARGAGAGVEEAADMPWGDRIAAVTDPDGYRWVLATFKKLVPFQ